MSLIPTDYKPLKSQVLRASAAPAGPLSPYQSGCIPAVAALPRERTATLAEGQLLCTVLCVLKADRAIFRAEISFFCSGNSNLMISWTNKQLLAVFAFCSPTKSRDLGQVSSLHAPELQATSDGWSWLSLGKEVLLPLHHKDRP